MKYKETAFLTSLLLAQSAPVSAMWNEEIASEQMIQSSKGNVLPLKNQPTQQNVSKAFDPEQLIILTKPLKSIEVRKDNLAALANIDGIVLIGSSGAGKTTLLNEIRGKCKDVSIPKRYITRPIRLNEDSLENIHLDKGVFLEGLQKGIISCPWIRKFEGGREEYYGFESTSNGFPIYSANNSFLDSETMSKNSNYLIIAIHAPQDIRSNRLSSRSPDFSLGEAEIRVIDPYEKAEESAHLIVHNYGEFEQKISKSDLVTFVHALKLIKSGWGQIKDLNNHVVEYRTRLFDIINHDVEFSDGSKKTFQYARRSPGVRTLIRQDDKFLINAEWRTEINGWDYRLPGGKVFENTEEYSSFLTKFGKDKLPDKAKKAAIAEIQEECGLSLKNEQLQYLETSKCGATVEWDLFYYLADFSGNANIFDHTSPEGERTLSLWLNHDGVLDLCLKGDISEDRTTAILMRFILNSKKQGGKNE